MINIIDTRFKEIRDIIHSRIITSTTTGYSHIAKPSWVSWIPQNEEFTYYDENNVLRTGRIISTSFCYTDYLLETPNPVWYLPLPYRGCMDYEEFVLRISDFKNFANIVIFSDTVRQIGFPNAPDVIEFESLLFFPIPVHLSALEQSQATAVSVYSIVELLRNNSVKTDFLSEFPRRQAKFNDKFLGEFIIYRLKNKLLVYK